MHVHIVMGVEVVIKVEMKAVLKVVVDIVDDDMDSGFCRSSEKVSDTSKCATKT